MSDHLPETVLKISELPTTSGVDDDTLLVVVDDPAGTPRTRKASRSDVLSGVDAASLGGVPASAGIVVVDSATPVTRPTAKIVLWLDDDTNAVAGDWRIAP